MPMKIALEKLINKVIGTKGPLRVHSFWMREIFLNLMSWAEQLSTVPPDMNNDFNDDFAN